MSQATVVEPEIKTTKEYSIFKLMKGNRTVDYNHVKRLKREMKENPHLFASNPISVNENLYIIDGQHRRQAAQELNVPVYYVVTSGITLDETRALNVTQKRWTLLDFAQSYAESGREDYQIFLKFVKEFPRIAPSIIRTYAAGGQKSGLDIDFRRGEFSILDVDITQSNLQRLNDVIQKTKIQMNTPMAIAFMRLFNESQDFDYEFFMGKLERETAREMLRTASTIRQSLRSIEDVYNFQSKTTKRLY